MNAEQYVTALKQCIPQLYQKLFYTIFYEITGQKFDKKQRDLYQINSTISLFASFQKIQQKIQSKLMFNDRNEFQWIIYNLETILLELKDDLNINKYICIDAVRSIMCFVYSSLCLLASCIGHSDTVRQYLQNCINLQESYFQCQIIDYEYIYGYFCANPIKLRKHKFMQNLQYDTDVIKRLEEQRSFINKKIISKNPSQKQRCLLLQSLIQKVDKKPILLLKSIQKKTKMQYVYKLKIMSAIVFPYQSYRLLIGQTNYLSYFNDHQKHYFQRSKSTLTRKYIIIRHSENQLLFDSLKSQQQKQYKRKKQTLQNQFTKLSPIKQVLKQLNKFSVMVFDVKYQNRYFDGIFIEQCMSFQELLKNMAQNIEGNKQKYQKYVIISEIQFNLHRKQINNNGYNTYFYILSSQTASQEHPQHNFSYHKDLLSINKSIQTIFKKRMQYFSIIDQEQSKNKDAFFHRNKIYLMIFSPQNHKNAYNQFKLLSKQAPFYNYITKLGAVLKQIDHNQSIDDNDKYLIRIYKLDSFFYKLLNLGLIGLYWPRHCGYLRYIVKKMYKYIQQNKTIITKNLKLYRYTFLNNQQLSNIKKGQILQNNAFMSTSKSKTVAQKFGNIQIIILVTNISSLTNQGGFIEIKDQLFNQYQYLFNPLNYFEVKQIINDQKQKHIILQHINLQHYRNTKISKTKNLQIAYKNYYNKQILTNHMNLYMQTGQYKKCQRCCIDYLIHQKQKYFEHKSTLARIHVQQDNNQIYCHLNKIPSSIYQQIGFKQLTENDQKNILYQALQRKHVSIKKSILYTLSVIYRIYGQYHLQRNLLQLEEQLCNSIKVSDSQDLYDTLSYYLFITMRINNLLLFTQPQKALKNINIIESVSTIFVKVNHPYILQQTITYRARILNANFKFKQARQIYDSLLYQIQFEPQALNSNRNIGQYYSDSADNLLNLGQFQRAQEHYQKAITNYKQYQNYQQIVSMRMMFKQANLLYIMSNYNQAQIRIQNILQKLGDVVQSEHYLRCLLELVRIYIAMGELQKSRYYLDKSKNINAHKQMFIDMLNLYQLIISRKQKQQPHKLQQKIDICCKTPCLSFQQYQVDYQIGLTYLQMGNLMEAQKLMNKCYQLVKNNEYKKQLCMAKIPITLINIQLKKSKEHDKKLLDKLDEYLEQALKNIEKIYKYEHIIDRQIDSVHFLYAKGRVLQIKAHINQNKYDNQILQLYKKAQQTYNKHFSNLKNQQIKEQIEQSIHKMRQTINNINQQKLKQ